MKLKLLMGILLSAGIASSSYVSTEDFFRDEKTVISFSDVYENNGELKITVMGKQDNREEFIEKTPIKNVVEWGYHDGALSPYSTAIYKIQVLLGLKMYNDFPNYTSSQKTFHTLKSEITAEDKLEIGVWGNMYKVSTYVRPDMTTHEKKTVVGQYMIEQKEELVETRSKFWDGTSFEITAWNNWRRFKQTRYNNFKADVYNLILTRYERASENETGKFVSETKTEVLKNKCERGDEPTKPPYQASWN